MLFGTIYYYLLLIYTMGTISTILFIPSELDAKIKQIMPKIKQLQLKYDIHS